MGIEHFEHHTMVVAYFLCGWFQLMLTRGERLWLQPLLVSTAAMKLLDEIIGWVEYHYNAQLYNLASDHASDVIDVLSQFLEAEWIWMGRNRPRLNPSWESPSLALDSAALSYSRLVHNWGIILDSWLLHEKQMAAVANGERAFAVIHLMCQLYPFLNQKALQMVTNVLGSGAALEDHSEASAGL